MLKFYLLAAILIATTAGASAQQPGAPAPRLDGVVAQTLLTLPEGFDGAAPPELPSTMSRDSAGRTTVRAVRLVQPLVVDGALDEEVYRTIAPFSDFIQTEPMPDAPATEKTEVWILFDSDNIYVVVRASESQPERMVVNEMRRDSNSVVQNENFQFIFDTFHDRKNGMAFQFNPIGGRMDGQVANENSYNGDFNPVWQLAVRRVPGGWTGEAAVPFKSLRYNAGQAQVWGFQARRINRWKNETSYLTSVPAGLGIFAFQRASRYATMVGLEVPAGSRALDVKPYLTSNLSTDVPSNVRNTFGKDVGLDAKYAVTRNLTADLTVNTDFAQVEADEQQVNLTRFSLFFPEKRDFFLENQGVFVFAGQNGGNGDSPTMFYSRRIGLEQGTVLPIDAGGRLSGRIGRYDVGFLNIQTGNNGETTPSTNFNVVRVRRDILRRSAVGMLFTNRTHASVGDGSARAYGIDGAFAFYQNLFVNTYWAKTETPGAGGSDTSYRTQLNYNADRYGLMIERLNIGEHFRPEVGFVRRSDFTKNRAFFRFSPRTVNRFKAVRKFGYEVAVETFDNAAGRLETRERSLEFSAEFRNSDRFEASFENTYELLTRPFAIASTVTIPAGGYDLNTLALQYQFGQQRAVSGTAALEVGPFYDGTRRTLGFSSGRVKLTSQLAVEPGLQVNWVRLPYGDFTTELISARTTYTVTPLAFVSALVQYNSSTRTLSSNLRFRWEYQPGSELFLVYNDGRDTTPAGAPVLQNRSLVFKVNRLFRF